MIRLERHEEVFVLQMDNGENRFNCESVRAMSSFLDEVEAVKGPAALVTTGSGKFYSNGFDLVEMMADDGANLDPLLGGALRVLARILTFPAPTVAAINGHAFGAGAQFGVAHDFQVMRSDRGYWCMPEVDMPAPLHPGMVALLQARIPTRTVAELITTGRRYGGPEALEAGIVDEVANETQVLERAIQIAAPLAAKADPVMCTLKTSLYGPALSALALPPSATPGVDPSRPIQPR
ncbi:MAG: enoyl-CoA hydratase/isomerase family protein [Candidatus Binatia bacterium]|nr:enoyl-CoA hydratase/isomerase family protein [bacterium]MDG1399099.1 enoyl-CoA hydratase/isomerase family protein [Candidatus Binatia bacterium]MDG1959642.1 enoyl-CoA hydratase/isomerase family protein [Candidatus Binatia bacterium]MDG2010297.1 enoyl-CoA hydratase/isomerase family protein [Candidatus Binatia bacterium]